MHNDSVDFVVKSIQKTPLVNLNGVIYQEYEDFFDQDLLNLLSFETNEVELKKFALQHDRNRMEVSHDEKVMKHITIFFRNQKIKKAIEQIFGLKLGVASADIWFDGYDYKLEPHTDFTTIQLSLQIYLGDERNKGTCLFDQDGKILKTFPYKKNCGYSLLNNAESLHGTEPSTFQVNNLRKSIYVRWEK